MTDTVLQSFCERCGRRYSIEVPQEKPEPPPTPSVLGRFKRKAPNESASAGQWPRVPVDDSHVGAVHFCLECRRYNCTDCWNAEAGYCVSCRPPGATAATDAADMPSPARASAAPPTKEPNAWPSEPKAWPSETEVWPTEPTRNVSEAAPAGIQAVAVATEAAAGSSDVGSQATASEPASPESAAAPSGSKASAAGTLDEWGRPKPAMPVTKTPTPDAALPWQPSADVDPWRGVVFSSEDEPSGRVDRPASAARASASAWPRADKPPDHDLALIAEPATASQADSQPDELEMTASQSALVDTETHVDAADWTRASASVVGRGSLIAAATVTTSDRGDDREAQPEPEGPIAEVEMEAEPVAEVEAAPAIGAEAEPEAAVEAQPEPEAADEAEPEVEAEPEPEEAAAFVADTEPEFVAEAKPILVVAEAEPAIEAEAVIEDVAEAEPVGEVVAPDTEVEVEVEAETESAAEAEPAIEIALALEAEPEPEEAAAFVADAERGVVADTERGVVAEAELVAVAAESELVAEPEPAIGPAGDVAAPETEDLADVEAETAVPVPMSVDLPAFEPPTPLPPPPLAPVYPPPGLEVWSTPAEPGPFARPYQAPAAIFGPLLASTPPAPTVPTAGQPPVPKAAVDAALTPPPAPMPAYMTPQHVVAGPPPPLPALARPAQAPARQQGATRACPNCALPLSTKARFCRRCGAPQPG